MGTQASLGTAPVATAACRSRRWWLSFAVTSMLLSSCIRKSPGKIKDPSTGLAMLLNLRKIASSIVELASTPFSGLQPKIKRKLPVFGSSFTSSSSYTPSPSRNSSGMSSLHALKMASTQQFFFDARPLIYFSKGYFILRTSSSLHMTK